MEKRPRALLLDTDPDTLINLQRALEEANIDTTVTWNAMEAFQLIESAPFDLIFVGDHPPELNAATILNNVTLQSICTSVFVLKRILGKEDSEYFRRLGALGVIPSQDPDVVLIQVTQALATIQSKAPAGTTSLAQGLSLRAS